nr:restriction endonuclease subunit S [Bacillus cereus]
MVQEIKRNIRVINKEKVPMGYKKTKYGMLPVEWEVRKMKDIFKRVRNPVNVQENEDYKQIGIRSHGKGIFYKESVTGEKLGNKAVFWVEPDCFIVNIVFAWEMAVAKTTNNDLGFIASHRFPMYKPKQSMLDLDFITYLFKSPRGKYLLNLASPGGAGRNKTLGQKEFGELDVLIPKSVKEQKKIAEIILTWDKAIELKEKLIEQKKNQKKGVMQKLLTSEVRLPGFDCKWENKRIKNISKVYRGASPRPISDSKWFDQNSKIGWVRISDVTKSKKILFRTEQYLSEEGVKKSRLIKEDNIIMSICATVGKPIVTGFDVCIHDGFVVFDDLKLNKDYFYYALLRLENQWAKYGQTGSQMNLNIDIVGNEKVMFPTDLLEQQKIVQVLLNVDREIDLLESELELIRQQKTGLMQLLLTGKVRVKV